MTPPRLDEGSEREAVPCELWKPVEGWPSYEVSNLGRVRSIDRMVPNGGGRHLQIEGRVLTPSPNTLGYLVVSLRQGKKVHATPRVHRLVAQAFVPNPDSKPYVNHIDCNPGNARADNLEWCTQAENLAYANSLGRMRWGNQKGRRSPNSSLSDDEVRHLRGRYASGGVSLAAIGEQFGISKRSAGRVVHHQYYADVPPLPPAPAAQSQGDSNV